MCGLAFYKYLSCCFLLLWWDRLGFKDILLWLARILFDAISCEVPFDIFLYVNFTFNHLHSKRIFICIIITFRVFHAFFLDIISGLISPQKKEYLSSFWVQLWNSLTTGRFDVFTLAIFFFVDLHMFLVVVVMMINIDRSYFPVSRFNSIMCGFLCS